METKLTEAERGKTIGWWIEARENFTVSRGLTRRNEINGYASGEVGWRPLVDEGGGGKIST